MPKSPIGKHGFTLLELLLALSIGSIVATAVYGTFHTAIKAKTRAEAAIKPLRTARYFFSAIKTDLQHIPANTKSADLDCKAQRCTFPIFYKSTGTGEAAITYAPISKVCYKINPQKELIREIQPQTEPGQTSTIMAAPRQEIIGRDIRQLQFGRQIKENQDAGMVTVLITMAIGFESKPDPVQYQYAMLVEQTLQP